jgi:uncharacterized protein
VRPPVILDTGPLVALLNRRDTHHGWAKTRFMEIGPPLLTCEAVLSEACFLVRRQPGGPTAVLDAACRGVIEVSFALSKELPEIQSLMKRYANRPISLADACLVRMAELHRSSPVFTTDGDFRVYRRNGRGTIPLIAP